eukprot:5996442-Pyramimonas_sp.AAC.1
MNCVRGVARASVQTGILEKTKEEQSDPGNAQKAADAPGEHTAAPRKTWGAQGGQCTSWGDQNPPQGKLP